MHSFRRKGINLIETLITIVITAILLLGIIDMTAFLFDEHVVFNNDVQAMQSKSISAERLISKIREASTRYANNTTITIPVEGGTADVITGDEAVAVFVPQFDSSGNIIKPTSSTTSFKGIAFSIIPEADWNGGTSGEYVLIETNYDVNLGTAVNDPLKITDALPSSWSGGKSYLVAKDFVPANLSTMGTSAFDVQDGVVTFAFVPTPKAIYFASPDGAKNVEDKAYLTTVAFRNYRRN